MILDILFNLLAFIIALGVLITVHELGHFFMARLFKFPTPVFSWGFGPKLLSFTYKDVEYRLSAIPLGGYVKILGMGYDETSILKGEEPQLKGTRWQRALVLMAGPLMNVILAVILVAAVYMIGLRVWAFQVKPVIVEQIEAGSPAESSGIEPGDRIVAIDGSPVKNWDDYYKNVVIKGGDEVVLSVVKNDETVRIPIRVEEMGEYDAGYLGFIPDVEIPVINEVTKNGPADQAGLEEEDFLLAVNNIDVKDLNHFLELISARPGETVSLTIQRGGDKIVREVHLKDKDGKGVMDIMVSYYVTRRFGVVRAFQRSFEENLDNTTLLLKIIQRYMKGRGSLKQLSGPIDIAKISGQALRVGLNTFIHLLGLISLQLGIINLLPIPILDGGYLLILLIEGIKRGDLSMKLKERILIAGFYFLITLMLVILAIDLIRNVT